MSILKNMPVAGLVVIVIIAFMFLVSLVMLFYVCSRYKYLASRACGDPDHIPGVLRYAIKEYSSAYERFGEDVNTPAIIADAFATRLGGLMFCERFLNNAVSLFVTLGLFGTFLGLSLSVSSLTELIGVSNSSEWLSVLDSVGGGLMSALSGMGVAFYTSLVGVACSIILTILRAIANPESYRAKLENRLELWLDHTIASELKTKNPKKDADLVNRMIDALKDTAADAEKTLEGAAASLAQTNEALNRTVNSFGGAVERFNSGIRDYSEVDYNLRGTIERMDLVVRDLSGALRELSAKLGGKK